ncbi:Rrf2 family transcriptional regulator [Actinoplanes sp. TRM 88003]|uniref:Rrf2 family transcriptional regulator n=1 Tax=Paractinoplanes aksuensis TaxID=2939490 RepID=A0ABT1DTQ3_9ACTN|nr:Rrf2 family transcriptional regulator [Actinoplanes aksuensis]MCO8274232.1 Rrf2 family transcriptional regulator [Actinoplanes aksuensis]
MKMSGGVEWALHCAVVLSAADRPVPAVRLAELHDVSSSYLAKQLQALSRAGLIRAAQGHAGGYELARPADGITVLDVVEAVDGAQPAFTCTEIRQRGPLATPPEACLRPCPIARTMSVADQAWRAALRAVTVADLAQEVTGDNTDAFTVLRGWLTA